MPNYKLGSKLPDEIISACTTLTSKTYDHARLRFPLTVEDIQPAIMPPDMMEHFMALQAMGVQQLPKTSEITLFFDKRDIPGLTRDVVVHLVLRGTVYTPRQSSAHSSSIDSCEISPSRCNDLIRPNLGGCEPEKLEALAIWANRVVKQVRLKHMTDATVETVMRRCKTTAHVHAHWPLLATIHRDTYWITRFRHPPKRMAPYEPGPNFRACYTKRIQASDIVLTTGLMLGDCSSDPKAVVGSLVHFERFEKDPKWD